MDYRLLLHPLVGSVIGYVTNFIAIKMLFRPRRAYYILYHRIPFTPGIIPKNQARLASGTARAITHSLLDQQTFENTLLSEDILLQIKENVDNLLKSNPNEEFSIQDVLISNLDEENYIKLYDEINKTLTNNIYKTLLNSNISEIIADKSIDIIENNTKGLTKTISKSLVKHHSYEIKKGIDNYIENNGEEVIKNIVSNEITKYLSTSNITIKDYLNNSSIDISTIVISIYKNIIKTKLASILDAINLQGMIENRINSMEPIEMERLILSVINKELKALINLGAIIGFVIGIINIFI
ncbi:MAG: DUF445 family protein [Clostridia bacterium]|nr:DUF445 family protein [Clostridia bacterium]